ncbi:MAG: response regulator [Coxiellaceae bacterium]|nr:response regulator [Coxiellaceae bacterium]
MMNIPKKNRTDDNSPGKSKLPLLHTLILEDDQDQMVLLKELLATDARYHHEVLSADTVKEALELLDSNTIDLVLSDLNLPDSESHETLQTLHGQHAEVPIVIISAIDNESVEFLSIKFGAQDYIVKGKTDEASMLRIIYHSLNRHEQLKQIEDERDKLARNMMALESGDIDTIKSSHAPSGLWKLQDKQVCDGNPPIIRGLSQ